MSPARTFCMKSVNGAVLKSFDRVFNKARFIQRVRMDHHLNVMIIRNGRWARRDAKGPWPINTVGLAGLHVSCAKWFHARDIAILGGDGAQDVLPSGVEGVQQPVHLLSLVAMGTPIFDNLDLELIGRECDKRKRWEFLVTASTAVTPGGTGSVLNPIATF